MAQYPPSLYTFYYTAIQTQPVGTAHILSKQLPLFAFALSLYPPGCSYHWRFIIGTWWLFIVRALNPANTTHWNNVGSMLGQRHRRWPNIKLTLFQCVVSAELSHIAQTSLRYSILLDFKGPDVFLRFTAILSDCSCNVLSGNVLLYFAEEISGMK